MQKIFLLFKLAAILLPLSVCFGQNKNSNIITQAELNRHLSVLAHDSLEGREAGTKGHDKACDYLIRQYKELGIAPLGGEYRQWVELPVKKWTLFDCRIRDVKERRYMFGRDFYMLPNTRNPSLLTNKKLEVHWAGLGPLGDSLGLGLPKNEDPKGDHKLWLVVDTLQSLPPLWWKNNPLEKKIESSSRRGMIFNPLDAFKHSKRVKTLHEKLINEDL
jgi:hypothetical protein